MTDKGKLPFDQQTLQKVLQAAFLLQEHQCELQDLKQEIAAQIKPSGNSSPVAPQSSPSLVEPVDTLLEAYQDLEEHQQQNIHAATTRPQDVGEDYTPTLTQIAETQGKIEVEGLDLNGVMQLVSERLIDLAGAAGAAIGFVSGRSVRYRAAAGFRTPPLGAFVPLDQAACRPCIRSAEPFRCPDVNQDRSVNQNEFQRRGISSFIAVPLFQDGKVVGGLELFYSDPRAFTEQDVHTCQLMAALVTDAVGRDRAFTPDEMPAHVLPASYEADGAVQALKLAIPDGSSTSATQPPSDIACYRCGYDLFEDEQFCGQCGAPRDANSPSAGLQSKVASLWHMQEANKNDELVHSADSSPSFEKLADTAAIDSSAFVAPNTFQAQVTAATPAIATASNVVDVGSQRVEKPSLTLVNSSVAEGATQEPESIASSRFVDWSSALSARDFFEQFSGNSRKGALLHLWNTRRGDIYLAIAIILVACVICWGLWPNHPANPSKALPKVPAAVQQQRTQPAAPELSLFDRMLISLGLAEAPPLPVDHGNPSVQVWVDLHTALYYCPGADLYGKTPSGKYATQRDAQLDQFEPAYRKTCN